MKTRTHKPHQMHRGVSMLLSYCETESDFWPNTRHFLRVGEPELAFSGLYTYLLFRPDLWARHHALIKRLKKLSGTFTDFDELEWDVVEGRRSSELAAILEWRQSVIEEYAEPPSTTASR